MRARTPAAALAALALAGCVEPVDERWELDHDHVVAVRATPPRLAPGERARLDALIARAGGATLEAAPAEAAAPDAPPSLAGALVRDADGWAVIAPGAAALAEARIALGLARDADVPLAVYAAFPRPGGGAMYAVKTVWLGAHADNPAVPAATLDGAPMTPELVVPRAADVHVAVAAPAAWQTNWLASCGAVFQDDVATAFLRVDAEEACAAGELAVVVRNGAGGVGWRVWPLRVAD